MSVTIDDITEGNKVQFNEPDNGTMIGEVHSIYYSSKTLDIGVGVTVYGVSIDNVQEINPQ